MPLLGETDYVPSQKYVRAPEIAAHVARIAEKYNLHDKALFHTHAKELRWDDSAEVWITTTDNGDVITSQFLLTGSGPLNRPK